MLISRSKAERELLITKSRRSLAAICVMTTLLLTACSDGATRLAYQIESDVAAFERSSATKATIIHQPIRRWGNGCDEDYRLQVDKVGGLVIWCKDAQSHVITGSHSTSYNARFMDSPKTWIVEKRKGETVAIELEKRAGQKPLVIAVK